MEINRISFVSAPLRSVALRTAATDRFEPTAAERASDETLLHRCGAGCGCGRTAVGGDPIRALAARDVEVREHENRHLVEAGEWAVGAPQYTFVTASNGRSYAVGGKVHVDISEIAGKPLKTIEKMRQILKSCLAPDEPSDQDRRVAAQASTRMAEAQAKVRSEGARPA